MTVTCPRGDKSGSLLRTEVCTDLVNNRPTMSLTEKYGPWEMGYVHDHMVAGPGEEGGHYYLHNHPYYPPSKVIERARGREVSLANMMREATPKKIGSGEAIPRMIQSSALQRPRRRVCDLLLYLFMQGWHRVERVCQIEKIIGEDKPPEFTERRLISIS